MWIGSGGSGERRWGFSCCPGAYLRRDGDTDAAGRSWPVVFTVDGVHSAFDLTWWAHYEHSCGHSLGSPPPPKLRQAVKLFEQEKRVRRSLEDEAYAKEQKRIEAASKTGPSGGIVATSRRRVL